MGMRAPQAPGPAAPKAPLPEFQAQRSKVQQRINADVQGQQNAMQRRLAASGMLNSGSAIKQQNIIQQQGAQQREQALADVDSSEMAEAQRRQEVMDARNFQGSESAMARALQQEQFGKQFGLSEKQFEADRGDQQRNIAASISNMKGDQLDRYNAFLESQGMQGVPGAKKQAYAPRAQRGASAGLDANGVPLAWQTSQSPMQRRAG